MYETHAARVLAAARLLVGIDRLDYSKGLPQRVRAFRELLAQLPREPPQRDADPDRLAHAARRWTPTPTSGASSRSLCGAINGDYGELDWMPVRYIHRMVARKRVPGLCRAAAVGLVTPLRDGMNLVAKEYIAAQDPADPGVLVLSRFAGAAEQLKEALLVNPYDTARHRRDAMQQALQMPLEERRERHQTLLSRIRAQDVHWWRRTFLDALREAESVR